MNRIIKHFEYVIIKNSNLFITISLDSLVDILLIVVFITSNVNS